jgi:hypothetical protein
MEGKALLSLGKDKSYLVINYHQYPTVTTDLNQ